MIRGPRGFILPLIVAVVAFVAAGWLHQDYLQQQRLELTGVRLPLERAIRESAEYSATAAAGGRENLLVSDQPMGLADVPRRAAALSLGGFRGFYAIYLWTTAEENKNLRVHEDLLDTYYSIANLQPDYPTVYSFHAWNLAWNLSAQWATAERRYDWIRHGIDFLREGIQRNPDSLDLYETMGRIYYWRIADNNNKSDVAYMTQRVIEEDGAPPLLMAYRWYRQARIVQDMTGQKHSQHSKEVLARQSCYAINAYAKEVTVELLELQREAARLQLEGETEAAEARLAAARQRLTHVLDVWKTTVDEWTRQTRQYPNDYNSTIFRRGSLRAMEMMNHLAANTTLEDLRQQPEAFLAVVVEAQQTPLLVRPVYWADEAIPTFGISSEDAPVGAPEP